MINTDITPEQAELLAEIACLKKKISEANARIAAMEAGQEPVAWMVRSDNDECYLGFDKQDLYREVLRVYDMVPLYTTPPTVYAAVAAALMKAEEVAFKYGKGKLTGSLRIDGGKEAAQAILQEIRAIPRDQSALRDLLMKMCDMKDALRRLGEDAANVNIVERVLKGEA